MIHRAFSEQNEKEGNSSQNRFGKRKILFGIAAAAAFLTIPPFLLDGWFTVTSRQRAVVERLGSFNRAVGPGFHMAYPWPLEKVTEYPAGLVITDAGQQKFRTKDSQNFTLGMSIHYKLTGADDDAGLREIHVNFSNQKNSGEKDVGNAGYDNAVRKIAISAAGGVIVEKSILDIADYDALGAAIQGRLKEKLKGTKYPFEIELVVVTSTLLDKEAEDYANRIAMERQRLEIIKQRATNAVEEKVAREKEGVALAAGTTARLAAEVEGIREVAKTQNISFAEAVSLYKAVQSFAVVSGKDRIDVLAIGSQTLPLALTPKEDEPEKEGRRQAPLRPNASLPVNEAAAPAPGSVAKK